jgi:uncharacterized membrane protein
LVIEQWTSKAPRTAFLIALLASLFGSLVAGRAMLLPATGFALAALIVYSLSKGD